MGGGDWDIFTHSANTCDLLLGLFCEVLPSNSWLSGNLWHRVGTVLTLVSGELCSVWPMNFRVCPCYCVSSLSSQDDFLVAMWCLNYSIPTKSGSLGILAVHIPESAKPTIKFWFCQLSRVTILAEFPFAGHFVHV